MDDLGVAAGVAVETPRWTDHPLRQSLTEEFHARPFLALQAPMRGSHIALISGEGGFAADFAHLAELCRHFKRDVPEPAKRFSADFGAFSVKWEKLRLSR